MRYAVAAASIMLLSCVTLPANRAAPSAAASVGDRASIALSEVLVSVPSGPKGPAYENLHVGLAVFINPVKVSLFSLYEVEDIVRRIEPRISSHLVSVILTAGSVGARDLPRLRERIGAEAQSKLMETFSRWAHADEYEVEVAVPALYFTNGSVGRPEGGRRRWW